MSTTGKRTGRPAGGGDNRAVILAAARQEFAAAGFRGATLRSIAKRAGVDVALLSHYFGNKDGLFAATLELPDGVGDALVQAVSGPERGLGERVTRWYLGMWERPETREQMQVLARSALGNDVAGARMRDLLTGVIHRPGLAVLDENPEGVGLAMAHLLGAALVRYVIRLPPVADMDFETLVARTAPAVQLHLTGRSS